MRVTLDHLWWEIVESSAHGCPLGTGGVDGPPEVGDFYVHLAVQEKVLGFDITVDDLKKSSMTYFLQKTTTTNNS